MAWLTKRGRIFHVEFKHGDRHFARSLKTGDQRRADSLRARLEDNLLEVERGRLQIPIGSDPVTFLLSDGRVEKRMLVARELTLAEYFERYQKEIPAGNKEPNTRRTEDTHIAHLRRLIGDKSFVRGVTLETLQQYVNARAQEIGWHKRPVSHVTIRKEIGTFATIWNRWAYPLGLVNGPAPTKNLLFQKTKTKAPFQTLQQIQRQLERGQLSEAQHRELWDSVYLTLSEIQELLDFVQNDRHRFVYPMFVMAAHTGARRSEILRSQVEDFDFVGRMVRIREKKRDRSKLLTYRHVPMSNLLADVMMGWFAVHPGGQFTICQQADVSLSMQTGNHYFDWTLEGTKWEKLTGWHVFRHSFASNCAAKGVDQRMIDEWMGHQTEEMRRRYRHLFPHHQQAAMKLVFG
jgi:integrase